MNTRPRTRLAALALTAATLVTPPLVPLAGPARAHVTPTSGANQGTVGISLMDHPPETTDDPRAHRYIVGHLEPGQSLTRRLRVSNHTDDVQRLDLYAGPATVRDGRFLPADPGATSSVTRWITVDTPVLRLPPGASRVATVTLAAPPDVPSEEHYGVIWASHSSSAPPDAGGHPAGLDLISRVGVRVYLSTGEGRPAGTDFQIVDLRPIRDALGVAALVATVANVGGRAVDLAGALELTDGPGGLTAPPMPADPVTLAPGQSAEVPFRLPPGAALPPGEWRATLDLNSGAVRRGTTQMMDIEPHHVAPETDADGQAAPIGRVIATLVILAAFVLFFGAWRAVVRRRR